MQPGGWMSTVDRRHLLASMKLAAGGDAVGALANYSRISRFAGNYQIKALEQLVELEDDAPDWVIGRWVCGQATRQLTPESEARHHDVLELLILTLYAEEVSHFDPAVHDVDWLVLIAATDWAYRQLCVFEYGGLEAMLRGASPALIQRAGPVSSWVRSRLSGYRLEQRRDGVVRARDLATDAEVDVLDIGTAAEAGVGGFVVGRIVAIDAPPGRFFESRPLLVDEQIARAIAHLDPEDGPAAWLDVLTRGVATGSYDPVITWRGEWPLASDVPTDVVSDLLQRLGEPPLVRWLERQGVPPLLRVPAAVCDVVVRGRAAGRAFDGETMPIVGAALLEPGVLDLLTHHVVSPELTSAWAWLEERVPPPARERCRLLAGMCAASSGASNEDEGDVRRSAGQAW